VQQLFKQFKEQRLTNAALECEQLINRGTQQLTEVKNLMTKHLNNTLPVLLHLLVGLCKVCQLSGSSSSLLSEVVPTRVD
jgi:hypothetical protein